jgi:aldose 1-epimerase
MKAAACFILGVIAVAGCRAAPAGPAPSSPPAAMGPIVARDTFGSTPDGTAVHRFTLRNANGVEIQAIDYGAIITSIKTPDRSGEFADIVLGFDTLDGYLKDHPYFGALVGRYANRIAKGRFVLDGRTYKLATNDGANHLHGGERGFDKFVMSAAAVAGKNAVTFTRTSPDGEEGYPGNLALRVTYELTDKNQLVVDYHATTDSATPINLTQHSYFNLGGAGKGDVMNHSLVLNADRFTPVDRALIPTGEIARVESTPFDFRTPAVVGTRIDEPHPQLKIGRGYDHNWVLNRKGEGLQMAAIVAEPISGRTLEVTTTEPGVQFYTGNMLDGKLAGKGGQIYRTRGAFCLETQHYPDSPNQPDFPTTTLQPGTEYKSSTVFTFGVSR